MAGLPTALILAVHYKTPKSIVHEDSQTDCSWEPLTMGHLEGTQSPELFHEKCWIKAKSKYYFNLALLDMQLFLSQSNIFLWIILKLMLRNEIQEWRRNR